MRNQTEIKRQIDGLKNMKKTFPEFSAFGTPNHVGIDAQLDVLERVKLPDEIEEDDFENFEAFSYVQTEAERAEQWLNEETDEDLFE